MSAWASLFIDGHEFLYLTPMGGGRAVLPPLSDRARAGAVSAVPAYSPASVEQAP